MRPILLKGHSRSLTMIKYNREGDLLVSCAKDHQPCLWYSVSGERIGTFDGHSGAIRGCDISYFSEYLLTASADASVRLWNMKTGECLVTFDHHAPVRSVSFATGDKYFASVADKFTNKPNTIFVYEIAKDVANQSTEPILSITEHGHKGAITGVYWMPLNKAIMTTGEDGSVKLFDPKSGELLEEHQIHDGGITNVQFNKEKTLAITSSKDNTAKLVDVETFKVLKTYETDRPVNSASISPLKEHVVLGGGQEAMNVTTTSGRVGKFEARFFHLVYQEEFGRVKGHFGPINTIAFHPDGRSYASGAEDGYVRIHHFDDDYLKSDTTTVA